MRKYGKGSGVWKCEDRSTKKVTSLQLVHCTVITNQAPCKLGGNQTAVSQLGVEPIDGWAVWAE